MAGGGEKLIASNPNRGNYFIEEVVEAGMVLMGTEIKSMRKQSPNIRDSYVEVTQKGRAGALEAWLLNIHVSPYSHGNIWNHEPLRKRKLLLHKHQLVQMFNAVTQKGMTIIPTRIYLKGGIAKIELAVARGKKKHDKRADMKEKSQKKEIDQALKRSR